MTRHRAYGEFLKSGFWKKMTAEKKRSVGNRCERCGLGRTLQSHHVRYRADWYKTEFGDLLVLCRGCHEKEHGKLGMRGFWDDDLDIDNFFWFCTQTHRQMSCGVMPNRAVKKHIRRHMERFKDDTRVVFHGKQVLKFFRLYEVCQ